jgi:hypothetical protein
MNRSSFEWNASHSNEPFLIRMNRSSFEWNASHSNEPFLIRMNRSSFEIFAGLKVIALRLKRGTEVPP